MKTRMLVSVLAGWISATSALAWQPTGWSWWSWPYAYDLSSGDWYWLSTDDEQWVCGFAPASGWSELGSSGLAAGWSWWAWPYAYGLDSQAWHFANVSDTQWAVNLRTGLWDRFGAPSANPLVGRWYVDDGHDLVVYELRADMTVTRRDDDYVDGFWCETSGTYTATATQLTLVFTTAEGNNDCERDLGRYPTVNYSVNGDTLTVTRGHFSGQLQRQRSPASAKHSVE